MKMTTNLKLLTKGYSLEDIKAIGSIEGITDEDAISLADKGVSLADIQSVVDLTKEQVNDHEQDPKPEDSSDKDETDYKSLYEAEKAKVEDLQKKNSHSKQGEDQPAKTDWEVLCDLFKNDNRG